MQKKVMALCLRVQFFWPTMYNQEKIEVFVLKVFV